MWATLLHFSLFIQMLKASKMVWLCSLCHHPHMAPVVFFSHSKLVLSGAKEGQLHRPINKLYVLRNEIRIKKRHIRTYVFWFLLVSFLPILLNTPIETIDIKVIFTGSTNCSGRTIHSFAIFQIVSIAVSCNYSYLCKSTLLNYA